MSSVNQILLACGSIITALLIVALAKKEQSEGLKLFLFTGIAAAAAVGTIFLAAQTITKNQRSVTGGPVHWHADYEVFVCGESPEPEGEVMGKTLAHGDEEEDVHVEVDLKNPTGFSNRIGSSDFHEHGDNRIHIEGVVERLEDVRLAKFFEVIGGQLTTTLLRMPTDQGELIVQNGMGCPDGTAGTLQTFLYKTKGPKVIQEKLDDFPSYVISPESQVPPGDCLIIEFGPLRERTDKICDFYQIALDKGEYELNESPHPSSPYQGEE